MILRGRVIAILYYILASVEPRRRRFEIDARDRRAEGRVAFIAVACSLGRQRGLSSAIILIIDSSRIEARRDAVPSLGGEKSIADRARHCKRVAKG